MQASFTTTEFGDEARSLAAALEGRLLQDPSYLFGEMVLRRPDAAPVTIPDDLQFPIPDLCAEATATLRQGGPAAVSLVDWANTIQLAVEGDDIRLTDSMGADSSFLRDDLIEALRGCGGRFADFLAALGVTNPDWAAQATQLRAALAA